MTEDLGPQPEPRIEPGEPNPGGVDAVEDLTVPGAIPDLSPDDNPAVEENTPDQLLAEVKEPEDTSTKATRDHDDDEPEKESPA